VVVFGGGVVQNNPWLLDLIKSEIKEYAMGISLENLEIKQTKLKDF